MESIYRKKTTYTLDKSLFFIFCLFAFGCAESEDFVASENIDTKNDLTETSGTVMIYSDSTQNACVVLSEERIANPYNVDTLRRAMALVYPNGHSTYRFRDIQPTHYQIRFLPKNSEEFQLLDDSGIITTPIPLDRKIAQGGTSYFDPLLNSAINPYTWQYSIVPVDMQLPNVEYEIIGEIRKIEPQSTMSRSGENSFWTDIEEKAYEMCEYELENTYPSPAPRYVTRGIIEAYDSKVNGFVGVPGARVVFTGLTYIETSDVTDWSGYYIVPSYIASDVEVQSIIKWENEEWRILDIESNTDIKKTQAVYILPYRESVFIFGIKGGKQEKFATITRVLHRMYRGNTSGLPRPIIRPKMIIKSVNTPLSVSGAAGSYDGTGISIWLSGGSSYYHFRTMVHEMGHAMEKLCLDHKGFSWISESWASLLANYITKLEYKELSEWYNIVPEIALEDRQDLPGGAGMPGQPGALIPYTKPDFYNKQQWPLQDNDRFLDSLWEYTPLLIDLVDSDNQREYQRLRCAKEGLSPSVYKQFPEDKVSGYTLPQIATTYSMLNKVRDNVLQLKEFKEIIKTVRPNTTLQKVQIDTLFNKYIYYCEKRYK